MLGFPARSLLVRMMYSLWIVISLLVSILPNELKRLRLISILNLLKVSLDLKKESLPTKFCSILRLKLLHGVASTVDAAIVGVMTLIAVKILFLLGMRSELEFLYTFYDELVDGIILSLEQFIHHLFENVNFVLFDFDFVDGMLLMT